MRKILCDDQRKEIVLGEVNINAAVFAKKDGRWVGMVVLVEDKGWLAALGGGCGSTGYHPSMKDCIQTGHDEGYMFYTE